MALIDPERQKLSEDVWYFDSDSGEYFLDPDVKDKILLLIEGGIANESDVHQITGSGQSSGFSRRLNGDRRSLLHRPPDKDSILHPDVAAPLW